MKTISANYKGPRKHFWSFKRKCNEEVSIIYQFLFHVPQKYVYNNIYIPFQGQRLKLKRCLHTSMFICKDKEQTSIETGFGTALNET